MSKKYNHSIILTRKHLKVSDDDIHILNEYKENLLKFYTDEIKKINDTEKNNIIFPIDKAKLISMNDMINLIKESSPETILKIKLSLELIKSEGFLSGTSINSLFGSKRYKVIKNTNIIDGKEITCLFGYIHEKIKGYSIVSGKSTIRRHTKNDKNDISKMKIDNTKEQILNDHAHYHNWFKTKLISKGKSSRGYRSNRNIWLVQEEKKHRFYDFMSEVSKTDRTRYTDGLYEYDIKSSVQQYLIYKFSKLSEKSKIKLLNFNGGNKITMDYFDRIKSLLSVIFPKLESKKALISFINQYFKHKKNTYIDKNISYAYIYNNPVFDNLKKMLYLIDYSTLEYNKWETDAIYNFVSHFDMQSMLILHDAVYTVKDIPIEDLLGYNIIFKKSEKIVDASKHTKKQELRYEIYLKHRVLQRKNLKHETRLRVSLEYELLKYEHTNILKAQR